jgi:hypothetical protein
MARDDLARCFGFSISAVRLGTGVEAVLTHAPESLAASAGALKGWDSASDCLDEEGSRSVVDGEQHLTRR